MPRIRTLKPEHKQHRKVGMLTDREYRLWIGMITEADDEGRLVADAAWLRGVIFTYQPRVTLAQIAAALTTLNEVGLIRLYRIGDTPYAEFPSWRDHQRIERPKASKIPPYQHSPNGHRSITDESPIDHGGSEGIGSDQGSDRSKDLSSPPRTLTADGLIDLYNELAPDNVPAVATRSPERLRKARQYLAKFPQETFWRAVFAQYRKSDFLCGRTAKRPGHETFTPDFDWLLSKGKDGTENAVKVHDGKYRQ